jgi:hypothetical protein
VPGAALADANSVVPYLNQTVLLRPLEGVDDPRLDTVDDFFAASSGGPSTLLSMWPTPDLGARGWFLVGHPAFVVRAPQPSTYVAPPDVTIAVATTAAELAVAERVAIDGYPVDDARDLPAGAVLDPALLGTPLRYRVGRLEGRPVGVGASYVGHDVVNLCLAATLADARRRGVWESLVWSRLADAPALPAAAFTSDDSRPGFARMGFLVVQRLTLWLRPPGGRAT